MKATEYRGYTIAPTGYPAPLCFRYYKTEEGIDQGNVFHTTTEQQAKREVDERILDEAVYLVETYNPIRPIITKFYWISDAIQHCVKFNGTPLFEINSI